VIARAAQFETLQSQLIARWVDVPRAAEPAHLVAVYG
jgi:hypothetical protein